ncbi:MULTISPECIES: antitoxin [unclassified Streptomyces]|uniref:antitoxin n=1 Tax=unclassified Streptomyces TaxID=2593676 RepID=UPI00035E9379|nr:MULTISPECIES: antitoxin [unclassified Streptomyces]MYQ78618.1 antitoxin [Streptomyces sp. SID4923]MYW10705.1 antitoxin [Streptomyces sp. SID2563]NEC05544.1 antitoxin [Streptomyces sp. SID7909]OKI94968.1 kanamycin biosynthetic protein [Streptomyces sp. CB01249]WUC98846.1 antitoxin [Streptomyces sp. NBC_00523]
MGMLDKIKDMIKGHPDQARQGVEKGGDFVDKKTGGKYEGQVDSAQQKMNDQLGDRRPPGEGR